MNVPYTFQFNIATGTPSDYVYGIYRTIAKSVLPSGWSHYWEIESYTPSADINIAELVLRLIANNSKKIKFEVIEVEGRSTIKITTTSDGLNYSPISFIDGYISSSISANREFNNEIYGASTSGTAYVVELPDALCFYANGKGIYSNNWQFGFQAGMIFTDLHYSKGVWGLMAGQPTFYSSNDDNVSGWGTSRTVSLTSLQSLTQSYSSWMFINGTWLNVGHAIIPTIDQCQWLGDESSRIRNLVPIFVKQRSPFKADSAGGLYSTRYVRLTRHGIGETDLSQVYISLNTNVESDVSNSISWRYNKPASATSLPTRVVFVWSQNPNSPYNVDI